MLRAIFYFCKPKAIKFNKKVRKTRNKYRHLATRRVAGSSQKRINGEATANLSLIPKRW